MIINGVVHVGAHYGEEINSYLNVNAKKIVCFEPVEENFNILSKHASDRVKIFKYALGQEEKNHVMMFLSSNNKESSSVLEPLEHLKDHADVIFPYRELVEMRRLDSFKEEIDGCNYLSIDVQGYEYEVLLGSGELLKQFEYIYLEVNRGETYKNNHLIDDIDKLLDSLNFIRAETSWAARTWGDAFYIKKELING